MKAFLGGVLLGGLIIGAANYALLDVREEIHQREKDELEQNLLETRAKLKEKLLPGEEKWEHLKARLTHKRTPYIMSRLWGPDISSSSDIPGPLWVTEVKPTLSITPEDIQAVRFCTFDPVKMPPVSPAEYDDINLEIQLYPTPAFNKKLVEFAESSLGENGVSPDFRLMSDDSTISLNFWQATQDSVDRFKNSRLEVMITLHYTMRQVEHAMDMLDEFSGDGFELCDETGPTRDVLTDLMDARWGGNSEVLFLKKNK